MPKGVRRDRLGDEAFGEEKPVTKLSDLAGWVIVKLAGKLDTAKDNDLFLSGGLEADRAVLNARIKEAIKHLRLTQDDYDLAWAQQELEELYGRLGALTARAHAAGRRKEFDYIHDAEAAQREAEKEDESMSRGGGK